MKSASTDQQPQTNTKHKPSPAEGFTWQPAKSMYLNSRKIFPTEKTKRDIQGQLGLDLFHQETSLLPQTHHRQPQSLTKSIEQSTPDPAKLIRVLATVLVEVLSEQRSTNQLAVRISPEVLHSLRQRLQLTQEARKHGVINMWRSKNGKNPVRNILTSFPHNHHAEVTVLTEDRLKRIRAIAFRLDYRRNRWVMTALEIG